jgi:uncharacterized repeat protein (TIGR02543 family)/uncharacterized protein (TIGR02145 family)
LSLSASSANIDHSAGSSTGSILATTGTFASPSALSSSSGNAWGYAIDQNTTSTNANTVVNGFSSSYSTPTASLNWASANTTGTTIKATNQAANNDTTPVYYGVNTTSNLTAGTYTDTVTLSSIANTGNIVAPTITSISPNSGSADGGETVTITGTNFAINGASVTSAVKIGGNNCTNVQIYQDGATQYLTCTTPAGTADTTANVTVTNWTNTATLTNSYTYEASGPTFYDISDMQEMTRAICDTATTPDKTATALDLDGSHIGDTNYVPQRTLTDTRGDGSGNTQTYIVRKMADGNCWMAQNLDYDLKTTNTLTPDDSNVFSNWTPTRDTETTLTANSDNNSDYSYNPGDKWYSGTSGTQTSSTTEPADSTEAGTQHVGNYYNYYAATAGTGTFRDADGSICPRGWVLPRYTGNRSMYYLVYTAYGYNSASNATYSSALKSAPFNYILPGYITNTAVISSEGTYGQYWTSYAISSSYSYFFQNRSTSPYYSYASGSSGYRYQRNSIRCVSAWDAGDITITYNQGTASSSANLPETQTNASIGQVVTLATNSMTPPADSSYTVTYNANGGSVSPSSATVNTTYTANGWSTTSGGSQNYANGHVVTSSLNLYPSFAETGNSVTLPTPTRSGYTFVGWYTAATGGRKIGDAGASYKPTANIELYAQWRIERTIAAGTMQSATCNTLSNYDDGTYLTTYTMTDPRGMVTGLGRSNYRVRKLADGNCWMIDNLRLPGGTTVTSSDSDVTSNYTLPSSSTSGFDSNDGQFMYDNPNNTNGYDSSYYSWLVAVAKTSSPSSTQYDNVPTSICPKGWHLPSAFGASSQAGQSSSSVNGQFKNLYTAYSSTVSTFNTAFNSVFAGDYNFSSLTNGGSIGFWWSSTVRSSTDAYYLSASSRSVNPTDYFNRRIGKAIRCVLAS